MALLPVPDGDCKSVVVVCGNGPWDAVAVAGAEAWVAEADGVVELAIWTSVWTSAVTSGGADTGTAQVTAGADRKRRVCGAAPLDDNATRLFDDALQGGVICFNGGNDAAWGEGHCGKVTLEPAEGGGQSTAEEGLFGQDAVEV